MSKLAAAGLSSTVAMAPPVAAAGLAGERVGPADRGVEVGRALGAGEAGGPELGLEVRPALADEDGRPGALGDDRGERGEVDALGPATGDEHDRRVERPQRRDDRVGLRPLRIVDEAHAVDRRDGLEPVLDAGERGRREADPLGLDAEQEADGDGRQRVRDVVGARDGEVGDAA